MAEKKVNVRDMFKDLQKTVAEAGTTSGLSDIEGKKVLIVDFVFGKNETDGRDIVDATLEGGRHVRSGGQLVLDAFHTIDNAFKEKGITLEQLMEQGYGLQAEFNQRQAANNARKFYWAVYLQLVTIEENL